MFEAVLGHEDVNKKGIDESVENSGGLREGSKANI